MIFANAVLLLQLSVVALNSAPSVSLLAPAEHPSPESIAKTGPPADDALIMSIDTLPDFVLLTTLPDETAFAIPFERGSATSTPFVEARPDSQSELAASSPPGLAAFIASTADDGRARLEDQRHKRLWLALAVTQDGAATFDAWTTRRVISSGAGTEMDPLLRPFAGNASLYAAIQVAPVALEYLSWRMMHSHHQWERRTWWVPQILGAGMNFGSGVHNLGVH